MKATAIYVTDKEEICETLEVNLNVSKNHTDHVNLLLGNYAACK